MFTPQHTSFPQLSSEQEVYRKHRKDGPVVSILEWYLGDMGSFTIQVAKLFVQLKWKFSVKWGAKVGVKATG